MAWSSAGNIKGPTGATGSQGPTGATGSQGSPGTAATVAVGTTNTLSPGSAATVTNSGTAAAAVFNFGIPQGQTGLTGSQGPIGNTGATGTRGSQWFTGSGAPGTIGGSLVGDMYLDTASGNVYQLA